MSKSRVATSPAQISQNWQSGLKAAVPKIQQGVDAVQDNPAEKAAANIQKMRNGFNAAIDSGKTEAALRSVSLTDWKSKTKAKVGSNLSSGVDAAMPKRQKFDNYLVTTLNAILPEVAAAPSQTIDDSINRMAMVVRHMHDNPYKKGA